MVSLWEMQALSGHPSTWHLGTLAWVRLGTGVGQGDTWEVPVVTALSLLICTYFNLELSVLPLLVPSPLAPHPDSSCCTAHFKNVSILYLVFSPVLGQTQIT